MTAMDRDYSDGSNYLVDRFTRRFDVSPGAATTNTISGDRVFAVKTQLSMTVSVECESTWTGVDCNIGNKDECNDLVTFKISFIIVAYLYILYDVDR